MSLPNPRPITASYWGCRCGRVVIALETHGPTMWCPSAEAGIHDRLLATYP